MAYRRRILFDAVAKAAADAIASGNDPAFERSASRLEHEHFQPCFAQRLGCKAASRAGADDDDIVMCHEASRGVLVSRALSHSMLRRQPSANGTGGA